MTLLAQTLYDSRIIGDTTILKGNEGPVVDTLAWGCALRGYPWGSTDLKVVDDVGGVRRTHAVRVVSERRNLSLASRVTTGYSHRTEHTHCTLYPE